MRETGPVFNYMQNAKFLRLSLLSVGKQTDSGSCYAISKYFQTQFGAHAHTHTQTNSHSPGTRTLRSQSLHTLQSDVTFSPTFVIEIRDFVHKFRIKRFRVEKARSRATEPPYAVTAAIARRAHV